MDFGVGKQHCVLLTPQHKHTYCQLYMSAKVMRKVGQVLTRPQAEASFMKVLECNATPIWQKRVWAIQDDTNNTLGIQMLSRTPTVSAVAEIGIMLLPGANGKGIAKAALGGLVDHGFRHLKLQRIEATFDSAHLATRKLVESVGFKLSTDHIHHAGRTCSAATVTLCQRSEYLRQQLSLSHGVNNC